MTDPCWLPSAIMQTAGAIIGIYSIIFIFSFPKFEDMIDTHYENAKYWHMILYSGLYVIIIIYGCLTIYGSMLWLKALTTDTSFIILFGRPIDVVTEKLFTSLLVMLGLYTTLIIVIEHDSIRRQKNALKPKEQLENDL